MALSLYSFEEQLQFLDPIQMVGGDVVALTSITREVVAFCRLGIVAGLPGGSERTLERIEMTRLEFDGKVGLADIRGAPGAGVLQQIQCGYAMHGRIMTQGDRLRNGARRVTAPPSPSLISVRPRSAWFILSDSISCAYSSTLPW